MLVSTYFLRCSQRLPRHQRQVPYHLTGSSTSHVAVAMRKRSRANGLTMGVGVLRLGFHTSYLTRVKDDYYAVLGVSKKSTQNEIKTAYYKLAKEMHPDLLHNKGKDDIKHKFAQISAAYNTLGDPKLREKYDRFGHQADSMGEDENLSGFAGAFEDLFDLNNNIDFSRGQNVHVPVTLTFEEAARGLNKKVTYTALCPCPTCSGAGSRSTSTVGKCGICSGAGYTTTGKGLFASKNMCSVCQGMGSIISSPCSDCKGTGTTPLERKLDVKIPAGVDTDHQVRIKDKGNVGPRNSGKHGSLFLIIKVEEHPFLYRQGEDIISEVSLSVAQATLGDTIKVKTLDGQIELKIPPGIQHGEKRVIKGRGIGDQKRGNMYITFKIVVPTNLSKEQAELMREFGKHQLVNPQPYSESQFRTTLHNFKEFWETLKDKQKSWMKR